MKIIEVFSVPKGYGKEMFELYQENKYLRKKNKELSIVCSRYRKRLKKGINYIFSCTSDFSDNTLEDCDRDKLLNILCSYDDFEWKTSEN